MKDNKIKYSEVLELFKAEKIETFKKKLRDPTLSQAEKKILSARLLLRDKKWDEVIEDLTKLAGILTPFLTAEKEALISYSHSMKGNWQEAIIHNDAAIFIYHKMDSYKQLYNSYYNTSVYFSRLGLIPLSNFYLKKAQHYSVSDADKVSINLSLAANYSKLSKFHEAIIVLEEGFPSLEKTNDFELIITYNLVSSDIYCRNFEYPKALNILNKLIVVKKAPFRGRILFEHALLKAHINEDFSLTKWPEAVIKDPIYSIKAKVIDYLLTGQTIEAQKTWIKLAKKEPNNYLPNFEMKFKSDQNSLYFVFIKKIQNLKIKNEKIKNNFKLNGKQKILLDLLYQNKFPMSKEELIEKIWNVPYDPKFNSRFYKLVQRLKDESSIEIKNNHGGYLIEN